jgi:hypothetical protein
MNLQERIQLLARLGYYMLSDEPHWSAAKVKAAQQNHWFTEEFIGLAVKNIATQFLDKNILEHWTAAYHLPEKNLQPASVGVVMAGNIPLVGFHDFLCVFVTGNKIRIKPSSKDDVLIRHLVEKLSSWDAACGELIRFEDMLKGCDAYIATGSNNSSRYFAYYFGKYPHIIRRNRTSVAILDGTETTGELGLLADDVHQFFGMGCRNVTKIYVPPHYNFIPLLEAFNKYDYLSDHHHYKSNYDYNLALHILNNQFYMAGKSVLLIENSSVFSPISQLNYSFYADKTALAASLKSDPDLQGIIGHDFVPFGKAQCPAINNYADDVDTLDFLRWLNSQAASVNL